MKKDIIYKYLNVCINYFIFMEKSSFFTSLYNYNFLLLIGFRAINHIFLFNSNCIDSALENTEKAYIYYLEYLEQLNKTNMMNELNHMDAILFLYNKTIPNYTGDINTAPDQLNNMYIINSEINNKIMPIFHFINTVLFWENQNIKRYVIMKEIIFDYVNIFVLLPNNDILNLYFELAQKNGLLSNNDNYIHFLKESHKQIRKKIKNNDYCIEWKNNYIKKISDTENIKYNTVKELINNLLD